MSLMAAGILANTAFPDWLITVLLVLLLLYVSFATTRKASQLHSSEHCAQLGTPLSCTASCSLPAPDKARPGPRKRTMEPQPSGQLPGRRHKAWPPAGSSEDSEHGSLLGTATQAQPDCAQAAAEAAAHQRTSSTPASSSSEGGWHGPAASSQPCRSLELQYCGPGRPVDRSAMGQPDHVRQDGVTCAPHVPAGKLVRAACQQSSPGKMCPCESQPASQPTSGSDASCSGCEVAAHVAAAHQCSRQQSCDEDSAGCRSGSSCPARACMLPAEASPRSYGLQDGDLDEEMGLLSGPSQPPQQRYCTPRRSCAGEHLGPFCDMEHSRHARRLQCCQRLQMPLCDTACVVPWLSKHSS